MTSYIYNMVDTWASGGGPYTSIKMNATDNDSGSASLLMDLQVGGVSRFNVKKNGDVTFASTGGTVSFSGSVGFDFGTFGLLKVGGISFGPSNDLSIRRRTGANLCLGNNDAAAPVAQTLSVQSVVAGTTNTAGANLTITGSQGTGTGAGGSIVFQVAPAGSTGTAQNALATALTIGSDRFIGLNGTTGGLNLETSDGYNSVGLYSTGILIGLFSQINGLRMGSTRQISWSSSSNPSAATADLFLVRDAADTLALRNGTNAQAFNIYNTYTSGSVYERAEAFWLSNSFTIRTAQVGGSARSMTLSTQGDANLIFSTNSTTRADFSSLGIKFYQNILFPTDNTYDIGASGATRPRSVYAGSIISAGGYFLAPAVAINGNGGIFFGTAAGNRAEIQATGVGILALGRWGTGDVTLQFGGSASSFPAIKRSSTTLQARLADDSAFASVQGKLTTDTAYAAGTVVPTGVLTLYDSTGTAYRVPCLV